MPAAEVHRLQRLRAAVLFGVAERQLEQGVHVGLRRRPGVDRREVGFLGKLHPRQRSRRQFDDRRRRDGGTEERPAEASADDRRDRQGLRRGVFRGALRRPQARRDGVAGRGGEVGDAHHGGMPGSGPAHGWRRGAARAASAAGGRAASPGRAVAAPESRTPRGQGGRAARRAHGQRPFSRRTAIAHAAAPAVTSASGRP